MATLALPLSVSLAACSAAAPTDEASGTTRAALEGAFGTADCPSDVAAFLVQADNLGRAIAATPEFQQCVAANYVACRNDPHTDAASLIAVTQSANATKAACRLDLPATADGITEGDDEHSYGYSDVEEIKVSTQSMQTYEAKWNAGLVVGGFDAARAIWHEAMHVHTYGHGANDASGNAACGYDGVTTIWNQSSGPYAVGNCMLQQGPAFVPNATAAAHKRLVPSYALGLYQQMAQGSIIAEQARALAARNGVRAQATPLTLRAAPLADEIFDAADQDFFVFTLPTRMPITIAIAPGGGYVVPPWQVEDASGTAEPASSMAADRSAGAFVLDAGTYYVHVTSPALISAPRGFTVAVADVPLAAPSACTASIVCGTRLDVTCGATLFVPYLQHEVGGAWTGNDPMSAFLVTDGGGSPVSYRVCQDDGYTGATLCTPLDLSQATITCDGNPPGGGPTGGAGGKHCHGHVCTTG